MKQTESTLLALLRTSLYGIPAELQADTDWAAVLSEANAQTVTALAAKALPDTLTEAQRQPWKNAQYAQLANYVRYLAAQDELCRLFESAQLPMVILKGSAAAFYYPQPSLRMMGDIDFLIPSDQEKLAKELLQDSGYQFSSEGNERHVTYKKNGVDYEMHRRFSYRDLDIEKYVSSGLNNPEYGKIDDHVFPMLPRLANGLVLLAHMRRHLRVGLGLRQVIDWMMYVERELDDAFWRDTFCAVAKEKNLDTLAITTTRLCQKYLGLSERLTWCAGADDALCELLLENLFRSGNFGKKNSSGNLVQGVMVNIRREGLFPYLQRIGERDWELYHQHRWLKPFAWLHEGFVFLQKYLELRRKKKPVLTEARSSEDRYEMLKKLNID